MSVCLSVNTHTHASVHTHNWSCLRMRCTYIIRKHVFKNSSYCYTSLFIWFFHRNRLSVVLNCIDSWSLHPYLLSLRAFLTYHGRPGQFAMGAKLFIRIPLIRKQVILKNKPVWAMWKCSFHVKHLCDFQEWGCTYKPIHISTPNYHRLLNLKPKLRYTM